MRHHRFGCGFCGRPRCCTSITDNCFCNVRCSQGPECPDATGQLEATSDLETPGANAPAALPIATAQMASSSTLRSTMFIRIPLISEQVHVTRPTYKSAMMFVRKVKPATCIAATAHNTIGEGVVKKTPHFPSNGAPPRAHFHIRKSFIVSRHRPPRSSLPTILSSLLLPLQGASSLHLPDIPPSPPWLLAQAWLDQRTPPSAQTGSAWRRRSQKC